jgi:hypothetical protein
MGGDPFNDIPRRVADHILAFEPDDSESAFNMP